MQELSSFIQSIYKLPEDSLESYLSNWQEVNFKRKEIITRPGMIERHLYFVLQGYQRSYYEKDAKQHIIAFTYPPSFSGIPESFITQTKSLYYLECITDSIMLKLAYSDLKRLIDEDRHVERLMRIATEQVLIGFIDRYYEIKAFTIEERFKAFLKRSPHLLNAIPHKYLAMYLGIDPTNFSKLLGSVKL